ncbi:hypothetical protein SAMN03159488_00079 [Pseudomonas sp. NFIX10]|uniref:hypothetical protein n=1 Tax=unclassified Pseudomonas TaxID=196821 RepID=UPI0008F31B02|nr:MULTISPECIES: hypothetical protein [unclassified Pseudomonas]SFA70446.1 hypothetical protein SAMN03159488_00079 [Pseudomonas sp. NFIX10]SFE07309.1 hypothetical protein SAMN03159367_00283 [Pseudomonas sp. NFACC06-1]
MKIIVNPEDKTIELMLTSFYVFLAAGFFVFSIGAKIPISFGLASNILGAVFILLAVVWGLIFSHKESYVASALKQKSSILIFFCALTTGIITSSINRPDIDDSVYAPKAVFYTENPSSLINNSITWVAGIPTEANSFVFQYYEVLQASSSWLLGVHFLTAYHVIFPFLVGFLAFCSIYLLLGLFHRETRIRLAGAIFLVMLALLLGETHRTYGNLSIARAFHGKFVLFYLGFYSWVYFSIKYFNEKKVRQILHLSIVSIALTTLTTTSFIYVPFLALTVYLAFFLSRGELFSKSTLTVGIGYFIALFPTAMLALDFRQEAQKVMPAGSSINSGFSADFLDQIGYLINSEFPLTPFVFFLSLIFVGLFSPHRKLFILWTLIPFVVLLNPVVSGFVIRYITTENAYWRMFYLLPFPLISAIAFCSLSHKARNFKLLVSSTFLLLGGLTFISPSSVFRPGNGAEFDLFSYKIHEPIRSYVSKFANSMKPGSVFAPLEISGNLIIYSSKFPQYYLREDYLGLIVSKYSGESNALERNLTASYLYGSSTDPAARDAFHKFVDQYKPDYLILNPHASNSAEAGSYLAVRGYSSDAIDGFDYQTWSK